MHENDILNNLGYCGLNCGKCISFSHGEIKSHADALQKLLGEFERYAERFRQFDSVFENYPQFKTLLDHFTQSDCHGCRSGGCLYPNCGVKDCAPRRGIDFCGQCEDFPCDHTGFDADLLTRWKVMNSWIREIGPEAYYKALKDLPRYIKTEVFLEG